jgi:hypothetical protein
MKESMKMALALARRELWNGEFDIQCILRRIRSVRHAVHKHIHGTGRDGRLGFGWLRL